MSVERISGSFISAVEALELAEAAVIDTDDDEGEGKAESGVTIAKVDLENPETLAVLQEWQEKVDKEAADILRSLASNIEWTAKDEGLTATHHVEVYPFDVEAEDGAFIIATADLATRAVVDVLKSQRYRVSESSQKLKDMYDHCDQPPVFYRVQLEVDWSAPLPPEQDNES